MVGNAWVCDAKPKLSDLTVDGVAFVGGVRTEIVELLTLVLSECARKGYVFRTNPVQNWGFACRPTKRSSGSPNIPPGKPGSIYTTTPSNHSWGLAVDINSAVNVYGGSHFDFPQWMLDLLKSYGFRWLGPPIKDQQHFDFCGEPSDAVVMTEKARRELGGDDLSDYADGQLDYLQNPNRPIPLPAGWSNDKKNGYKVAKALASTPRPVPGPPGPVDPNSHTHKPGIQVAGAPE